MVLTIFPSSLPPASTTAFMFFSACSACASTPPSTCTCYHVNKSYTLRRVYAHHLARSGVQTERAGREEQVADLDGLRVRAHRGGCTCDGQSHMSHSGACTRRMRCSLEVETNESDECVDIVRRGELARRREVARWWEERATRRASWSVASM